MVRIISQSVDEGLIDGRQASQDGATVAANVCGRKLWNMPQVEYRLEQLEQALWGSPQTASQQTAQENGKV